MRNPLNIKCIDGNLRIEVGFDTIKFAIEHAPFGEGIEIVDPAYFAHQFALVLEHDDTFRNRLLTLFDDIGEQLIEDDSPAIKNSNV